MDNIFMINASIGKRASEGAEGLEGKVKASMRAVVKENFLELDEDKLFRAAIGGVLLDVDADCEDVRRLKRAVDKLQKLGAFLAAAQVGLTVSIDDMVDDDDAILPLMPWWREISKEGSA